MSDLPLSHPLRTASLPTRKPQRFRLAPDAAARAAAAVDLGITAIPALTFEGEITAKGRSDFVLKGKLVAKVEQPCVVTLAPVVTPVTVEVLRRYSTDFALPEADESETPDDDTLEPLGEEIDVGAVALEELALNLPDYPRAEGADLGEAVFTEAGTEALKDDDLKPFASLAALKAKLESGK